MNETSKAMRRRWCEHARGEFPWRELFTGRGLDLGAGDDPLRLPGCSPFDRADGDAMTLTRHHTGLDYLHASHLLHILPDPRAAVREWLAALVPGGHLIATVPDWVAYEGAVWPSRFNRDHRSTWSMVYRGSICPLHIYLPDFLGEFRDTARVRLARYVEANFDWQLDRSLDQTYREEDGVEVWNEFVLQKLP